MARILAAINVINMDGLIQARRVTEQADGTIILDGGENGAVRVAGKLDVSAPVPGVNAGKVTVTGETVGIASTARIDATAQAGRGGMVKIGDYQGKGDTRQARLVTVDAGALIEASAVGGAAARRPVRRELYDQFLGLVCAVSIPAGGSAVEPFTAAP